MNNQSGTVKMYSEKMCKSQTVQVKAPAPEIRIGGSIKFYDKQKDFGFIAADHGQDYYFRMSDFSQSVNGGLAPHTKVTFVPKSNRKKDKNSFATEIQLVNPPDNRVNTTKPAFRSDESLPPPCPHGDMLEYNKEMVKNAKISLVVGIVFICVVLIIILSHWHWR